MSSQNEGGLAPLDLPETKRYTHRAHRFPGKFHRPLITHLLKEYGEKHDVIADPMCGSGTAGVEAAVAGKDALCNDIDPLSALMTRGKTHPVDPNELRAVSDQIIERLDQLPSEGAVSEEQARKTIESNLEGRDYQVPYNIFHWFEPHVATGYSELLSTTHDTLVGENVAMWDAVHTCLAAMVRQISRADPEPVSGLEVTKIRRQDLKEGVDFDVIGSFNQVVSRLVEGYEQLLKVESLGNTEVFGEDCRTFSEVVDRSELSPSMVVTSPPYCNAIEYSRRHRLEYEWLGLFNSDDVDDPRNERIETSRDYFGSTTPRQNTLKDLPKVPHKEVRDLTEVIEKDGHERKANLLRKYFLDVYDWISEIREVLPRDGTFCLIVGPSTSYGRTVDTPRYLSDIASDEGFKIETRHDYLLKNNKMQYPTEGETTDTESLIVFEAR